jgi:hypothetical protein
MPAIKVIQPAFEKAAAAIIADDTVEIEPRCRYRWTVRSPNDNFTHGKLTGGPFTERLSLRIPLNSDRVQIKRAACTKRPQHTTVIAQT